MRSTRKASGCCGKRRPPNRHVREGSDSLPFLRLSRKEIVRIRPAVSAQGKPGARGNGPVIAARPRKAARCPCSYPGSASIRTGAPFLRCRKGAPVCIKEAVFSGWYRKAKAFRLHSYLPSLPAGRGVCAFAANRIRNAKKWRRPLFCVGLLPGREAVYSAAIGYALAVTLSNSSSTACSGALVQRLTTTLIIMAKRNAGSSS